jgi:fructose-bisphosphate aldolase class 1
LQLYRWQAKTIEEQLVPIIENALTLQESRKDERIEVVKRMTWILMTLCQREDFTNVQIVIVGL